MADTEFNQILQYIPIGAMGWLFIIDVIFSGRVHWFYERKFHLKRKSNVIKLSKNNLFVIHTMKTQITLSQIRSVTRTFLVHNKVMSEGKQFLV